MINYKSAAELSEKQSVVQHVCVCETDAQIMADIVRQRCADVRSDERTWDTDALKH